MCVCVVCVVDVVVLMLDVCMCACLVVNCLMLYVLQIKRMHIIAPLHVSRFLLLMEFEPSGMEPSGVELSSMDIELDMEPTKAMTGLW